MTFFHWVICFFLYGMLGWIIEEVFYLLSTKKIVTRGFLNYPLCPVYGFGAIGMIVVCKPLSSSVTTLFFFGIVFTSILEYFTSYILERMFHAHWWDYTGIFMNIKGRICVPFSLAFGIATVLLVEYIHPVVESQLSTFSVSDAFHFAASLIIITFVDIVVTVIDMQDVPAFAQSSSFFRWVRRQFAYLEQVETKPLSPALQKLEAIYCKIAFKRACNNFETQRIGSAFPFFSSENAHRAINNVKNRFIGKNR